MSGPDFLDTNIIVYAHEYFGVKVENPFV